MTPIWLERLEKQMVIARVVSLKRTLKSRSSEDKKDLKRISAATIDRLLNDYKVKAGKNIRPPKPASAVKKLVEIRAKSWEILEGGWTEVDTVAHSGRDMSGDFIWTLTSVEVSSGVCGRTFFA